MNEKVFPIIGIRPTIDGRRHGVREALENQTMKMARSLSKFLSENIKYPNGESIECIIADTTISGIKEATNCKAKFNANNVGLCITVTPCWCYGSETMDMDSKIPQAVWGFNGTERPGAVYLAAVLAGYAQKGIPVFGIYGEHVQDSSDSSIPEDVQTKILRFAKAGLAMALMKNKSYLSIGSVSMGIAGSIVDDKFFQEYLGMRNEYVDMSELVRRLNEEIFDKNEFNKAKEWVKLYCTEGIDNNPEHLQKSREEKNKDWDTVIKMTLICRDLMNGNEALWTLGFEEESLGHNAIIAGFQGQRHWTDYFPNGDFMETILNSSFDWNGKRAPYLMATENDSLNAVSMLFGNLLTNTAQIFADVRTFWSPESIFRVTGHKVDGAAKNGLLHLINSGSAALDGTGQETKDNKPVIKPYWEISDEEVNCCLYHTKFRPASLEYFNGGGFSTNFLMRGGMPLTMVRVNLIKGLGPVLQIAEGYSVELPEEVHNRLDNRTDPTWPTTWFSPNLTGKKPFDSVYSVMANWGANHCSICYGHIGADLITLASMLRIPVNMHNICEDLIFRPSVWSSFGTQNLEGGDYRACKNFGPLYN